MMNIGEFLDGSYEVGSSDGSPPRCLDVLSASGIQATTQIGGYETATPMTQFQNKIGSPKPFI